VVNALREIQSESEAREPQSLASIGSVGTSSFRLTGDTLTTDEVIVGELADPPKIVDTTAPDAVSRDVFDLVTQSRDADDDRRIASSAVDAAILELLQSPISRSQPPVKR
jgi:hypothetical protein